ncbi:MAG: 4-hydroxy-tetrahydrodipicolinate synthase [Pseudomonadota bacterium]
MFHGSMPALITPFRNGSVDEDAYAAFIDWQIDEGTHGLVPVGTTGESPTLSHPEHKRAVSLCVEVANKRVPVIAGAGSNNTVESIELAQHAQEAGADAVLAVCPYYNRPTQEGLFLHYKALAEAIDIPVFIYNVPGRTVTDISVETIARLNDECSNIIGVKDATANLMRVSLQRAACGSDFIQVSGEDGTALAFNAHGGRGCISVTANVAPKLCSEFQEATLKGDFETALDIQDKLIPLHQALFLETSPAPVKYACSLLGKCSPDIRLPLAPVSEGVQQQVRAAMTHAGLLNA